MTQSLASVRDLGLELHSSFLPFPLSGVAPAITVRGPPEGPHDLGRLKKLPEAITGRELFRQLAALTLEELDLPVLMDGPTCYSDCSGLGILQTQKQFSGVIPAHLLLTRHVD